MAHEDDEFLKKARENNLDILLVFPVDVPVKFSHKRLFKQTI